MNRLSGFYLIILTLSFTFPHLAAAQVANVTANPSLYSTKTAVPAAQPAAPPPAPEMAINPLPVSAAGAVQQVPNTNVLQNSEDNSAIQSPAANTSGKVPSRQDVIYRVNLGRAADVEILIQQGASPDEVNSAGTPIIALASTRRDKESVEIIKILLKYNADINKSDKRGQNALFYAAKTGNKDAARFLLENKIKYSALDASGNNARIIAYQTGHNEIIEILDNFIRQQNNEVRQQYMQVNKELEERYNAYNAAIREQMQKTKNEAEQNKNSIIQDLIYEMTFSSCASAYWRFCIDYKQQTQFSAYTLASNMRAQNSRMRDFFNTLVNEQRVPSDKLRPVSMESAEKIKLKLLSYTDNEARANDGVGTVDDMKMRCNLIGKSWQARKEGDLATPITIIPSQIAPASPSVPSSELPPPAPRMSTSVAPVLTPEQAAVKQVNQSSFAPPGQGPASPSSDTP